ncbi:pimeloyl-ACP methyl ester carboxylesterase [Arthrobacter sp. W4I7]|nr:pimeloyl-ACP methyl ester carboxylesterase [Arthrobacter sp. W4I7]
MADYGIRAQAADLESALRDIRDRDPGWTVLVGASMGGMAAMAFAAAHPDDVGGLVLVDIAPTTESAGTNRIKAFMSAGKRGFDTIGDAIDAVAEYRPGAPRRDAASLRHNLRRGRDGRVYWHWDPEFHRPDNGLGDRARNRQMLLTAAEQITTPTLVVRGAESDVVSAAGVTELLGIMPHAEVVTIANAGHMVMGDDNANFVDAALAFIENHVPDEQ